jgi:DNA-binding transcriptional LysR family regulator
MNIVTSIHRYDNEPILETIDLRRLRCFLAVAEAGSFSRAAERSNVAQSHLSRQIMRLEQALRHRLFVRRARHVELTDAGQILLEETRFLTLKLDSLPERMNEACRGATGSLCIGFTIAGSLHSMAAQIIASLVRRKPKLSLNFRVAPRTSLIEAIVDRRVQASFVQAPVVGSSEIRVDNLVTEPVLLALHKGHRLAGRDQIDLSEIADEPFVMCERSWAPEIYDQVMAACQKAGFAPRVIYHAPQDVCALLLASAGVAVTFVPASIRNVHAEDLHFASLTDATLNANLALVTRADEHLASIELLRKRALAIAAFAAASHKVSRGKPYNTHLDTLANASVVGRAHKETAGS